LFSKVSAIQYKEFENILVNELGAQMGLFDVKTLKKIAPLFT
jgi:hypothetical protein